MATQAITIESENTTISSVVWAFYKSTAVGLVEKVLLANPGIADSGIFLEVGTVVSFPLDVADLASPRKIVRLWD